MNLDDALALLTAHPDFRILRRIELPSTPEDHSAWKKVVVLDTETTHLDMKIAKIIELGLVEVFYEMVGDIPVVRGFGRRESWLQDPGDPLSGETIRVTGLTDADVAGKQIPWDIVGTFIAGATILIAHNAAYDRPICERHHEMFKIVPWACSSTEIDWRGIYGSPSAALMVIAWTLGAFYDAHRALSDCVALAWLLSYQAGNDDSPFAMLVASCRRPWARLFATGADYDKKDALKARGYTWDAGGKVWHIDKKDAFSADEEQEWLKMQILHGREPHIRVIRAIDRYSIRV